MAIQQLFNTWLEGKKYQFSKHTIRAYRLDFEQFFSFLQKHFGCLPDEKIFSQLTTRDVRAWLSSRKDAYNDRSTHRAFSSIKSFSNFLIEKGIIEKSPFNEMASPKIKKLLPKPLSVEQIFEIVQNLEESNTPWANKRDQAFFMLIYSTGLRIQEALNLNQDILQNQFFTVLGKGNKHRSLPLLENVKQKLNDYLEACPFVTTHNAPLFYGVKGERLSPGVMQKTLKKYRELYHFPDYLTPHALRHSCATHLVNKSDNLRAVQDLLGHSSLSTTQIYTKVSQEKLLKSYNKAHPFSEED